MKYLWNERSRYVLFGFFIACIALSISVIFPNRMFLGLIFFDGGISFGDKISFLLSLLTSITGYVYTLSGVLTLFTAILVGVNGALLVYLIRRRKALFGHGGTTLSGVGMILALFGYGCVVCGSLLLTTAFTMFGGVTFLTALPLRGEEFSIVGVVVLCIATILLVREAQKPMVCPIQE